MTSPSFNYFYRVDLTVAQLGDTIVSGTQTVRQTNTKTYTFVNKELKDAGTSAIRETYIPILESIGEVTLNSGEILPTFSFSTITIDDSRGSFGADRKFSDILERYTVVEQPVVFYVGESSNETDAPSSWTQIGSGKVISWNRAISTDRPNVSFQIAPFKISERTMNLEVSRDISGMVNAPESSLGKPLPIVFCKPNPSQTSQLTRYPQIIPTRISADGATTAKYALCTHMYQITQANIAPNIYVKKSWEDGSDVWASVSFTRQADDYTGNPTGTYLTLGTNAATAYRIPEITPTNNETGFIATGVQFRCYGGGLASSTAKLDVFVLQVDRVSNSVVSETLATGGTALSAYNTQNSVSGSDFTINISFDQPLVIDLSSARNYDFYIGYKVNGLLAGDLSFYKSSTVTNVRTLTKPIAGTAGTSSPDSWAIGTDAAGIVAHKLLVTSISTIAHENTYTKDGLTYSSMTITQQPPDSGQVAPHLDALEMVVLAEGFLIFTPSAWTTSTVYPSDAYVINGGNYYRTESGGTSGSTAPTHTSGTVSDGAVSWTYMIAGQRCVAPHLVTQRLSYAWSGERWSNTGAIDTSTLQTSHYDKLFAPNQSHRARYVSGLIEAKSTYSQVISEVARGSACKIGVLVNQKLFVYPWGITADPAFNIPQADIIPLSWEVRDISTIVNRTQISFDKAYAIGLTQDTKDGYKFSIDYSSDAYLPVKKITEESRTLYGVQNIIENTFNVFGYSDQPLSIGLPGYITGGFSNSQPNDGTNVIYSVDFLADYLMSRSALPATYCSFVVPYHRYSAIKMFDVINFAHSEFPAFYGTDPNARPGVVDTGSTVSSVPNANLGEEFTRANTYRGFVEAVSYVMAVEHAPAIRLTVLVLLNQEYDPT